jgi:predicted nucleic acid-binding protein
VAEEPVLVDSSIWIHGFGSRVPEDLKRQLKDLLEADNTVITEMIRLEVIVGARSAAEFGKYRGDFELVRCLEVTRKDWESAEDLSFTLNRAGSRVGAADLLIAAVAISNRVPLWHADADFERIRAVASGFHTFWYPKRNPTD